MKCLFSKELENGMSPSAVCTWPWLQCLFFSKCYSSARNKKCSVWMIIVIKHKIIWKTRSLWSDTRGNDNTVTICRKNMFVWLNEGQIQIIEYSLNKLFSQREIHLTDNQAFWCIGPHDSTISMRRPGSPTHKTSASPKHFQTPNKHSWEPSPTPHPTIYIFEQ